MQAASEGRSSSEQGQQTETSLSVPVVLKLFGARWIAPVVLLAFSLLLFLPGINQVPPLDRDEPRFTQASKQMMETGDYVSIRFQDQARNKKPVGIHWLQVGVAKVLGFGAEAPLWVYRLPSVAGGVLAVLFTYWLALAFMSSPAAFTAGLLTASSIILNAESHIAKTDAMLLAFTVLSMGALARLWLKPVEQASLWLKLLFWGPLAGGVLIKGPIIILVVGLTAVALSVFERSLSPLKKLWNLYGFVLFLALVLPWFVAIFIATDGAFYKQALGGDFLAKVGTGKEGHGAPPFTHFLVAFVIFWPLNVYVIRYAKSFWKLRESPFLLFAMCWAVPTWIVFELVSTKLPHYTMPVMPALSLAVAGVMFDPLALQGERGKVLRAWSAAWAPLISLVLLLGAIIVPIVLGDWPSPPGVVLVFFGFLLSLYAGSRIIKGQILHSVIPLCLSALVVTSSIWVYVFSSMSPLWISSRLVEVIHSQSGCQTAQVFSVGFSEPSFVFLMGTRTKLGNAEEAADFLSQAPAGECRVAVVERRHIGAFDAALARDGVALKQFATASGINLNGGRNLEFGLFKND